MSLARLNSVTALALAAGAGLVLGGCGSDRPTAIATPKSHEAAIDAIKNNPNMPQSAKDQAIGRMQAADKQAGFLPTGKK